MHTGVDSFTEAMKNWIVENTICELLFRIGYNTLLILFESYFIHVTHPTKKYRI